MAKKKLSKKERKRREKARKAAVRERTGWESDNTPRSDKLRVLAPLLEDSPDTAAANMMTALRESAHLIDEPELEAFLFDPLETMGRFVAGAERQGLTPDDLFVEDPEEAALEEMEDVLAGILPQLLTKETRQELLESLDDLIERSEDEDQKLLASQAGLVRMVLADRKEKKLWYDLPLCLALANRSLEAGFAWMGVMEEIREHGANPEVRTTVTAEMEELFIRFPGLRRLAEEQVDAVWNEGLNALMEGDLYLGLLTEDELEEAYTIFIKHLGTEEERAERELDGPALVAEATAFLEKMLTPERLMEIRQQLTEIVDSGEVSDEEVVFVSLVRDVLAETAAEEIVEAEKMFWINLLLSELKADDYEDEDEDEDEAFDADE